jgi:hypothetical protein
MWIDETMLPAASSWLQCRVLRMNHVLPDTKLRAELLAEGRALRIVNKQ